MVFQNNVLSGAAGSTTPVYSIDQSIRFPWESITSGGYMHRTPSGAGDRTSWTWSCWFKLGGINGFTPASNYYYSFLSVDNSTSDSNRGTLLIIADSGVASAIQFQFQGHSTIFLKTNRQFRDPSAWMHLVLVWDSDNLNPSDRARLYINGQRETSFATQNNPTAGQEIGINLNAEHRIGGTKNISTSALNYPWDGYMAEIHFLDGYSYGPEFFGETKSNGLWIPKEYDGSYGSNGFKIDGRDASDLGDDESGNGNDFALSGLAAHDQVSDSPTNSFCVLNPVMNMTYQYLTPDIRDTNLASQAVSASLNNYAIGSMGVKSGKWYFEAEYPTLPALSGTRVGFISLENASSNIGGSSYGKEKVVLLSNRHTTSAFSNFEWGNGSSYPNTSATSQTPFVQDDIIGVAFDCDNSTIQFYKNGSTFGSQFDYSAQSNAVDTSDGDTYAPIIMGDNTNYTNKVVLNFGQDSTFNGGTTAGSNTDGNGIGNFKYSVPSGYLALCTKNLGS